MRLLPMPSSAPSALAIAAMTLAATFVWPSPSAAAIKGTFVTDIIVANWNDKPSPSERCPTGYTSDGTDANEGAGGQFIYLCSKTGGPEQAIRSLTTVVVDHGYDNACPSGFTTKTKAQWGSGKSRSFSGDLNSGAGGAFVFLCARWQGLGAPVKEIDVVAQQAADFLCEAKVGSKWLPAGRGGTLGFPTNLNNGATRPGRVHTYIHLCFRDLSEGYSPVNATFCGGEDELACPAFSALPVYGGNLDSLNCDRGLLEYDDGLCRGQKAPRHQAASRAFRRTWTYWAIRNQRRDLAADEPIGRVMFLGAHNAFNNDADGYDIAPNQRYSITDLLDAGMRVVDLDIHKFEASPKRVVVAHGVASATERFYGNAIKEVAQFLLDNPDETLIISLEAWKTTNDGVLDFWESRVNDPIDVFLDRPDIGVFTPADYRELGSLPSQRWMIEHHKRVLIVAQNSDFEGRFIFRKGTEGNPRVTYSYFGRPLDDVTFGYPCTLAGGDRYPESQLLEEVYESRITWDRLPKIDQTQLAKLAMCNFNIINLDQLLNPDGDYFLGSGQSIPEDPGRLDGAVWSWAPGQLGGRGRDVAELILDATGGRWVAGVSGLINKAVGATHGHFACRTIDAPAGKWWYVTKRVGIFRDGFEACAQEYPGSKFSVPVNAYENERLIAAAREGGVPEGVLLNYTDFDTDSSGLDSIWISLDSLDDVIPEPMPALQGLLGGNGWFVSDVNLSWSIESGRHPDWSEGCAPFTIDFDTPGTTRSCTVKNRAGERTVDVTVKRDMEKPWARAVFSSEANAYGWRNAPVKVSFACGDSLSGVAQCPEPARFGEGRGEISRIVTDYAGNSTVVTADGINIDSTPPRISFAAARPGGAPYEQGQGSPEPVRVTIAASDALSGIESANYRLTGAHRSSSVYFTGPQTVTITAPGRTTIAVMVRDRAGNTIVKQFVVDIAPPL